MRREQALQLLDDKIRLFQALKQSSVPYGQQYEMAYRSVLAIITELYSPKEAEKFRSRTPLVITTTTQDQQAYRSHLDYCIAELSAYRERVQHFWQDTAATTGGGAAKLPFVSMSFDGNDKGINDYVTSILRALQIEFETGERYSRDSVPEKVKSRIRASDLFILILVHRDKIEGGGYTAPTWLHKELGIAQGAGKDVIAWVERGIKDLGGLNYEKELILFDRDDVTKMQAATVKFLEALKEHGLV